MASVLVVLALTRRWGLRLPWWLPVLPAAVATGAVAPIALGLPVGALLQLVVHGDVRTGGEGSLLPAVFAVVYGGFAAFGVGLAVLFVDYVHRRWPVLLRQGPPAPPVRTLRLLAIAGMAPLAAATTFWALAPAEHGLRGWESIAQRTALLGVAVLTVVGCAALLARTSSGPRLRWALGWVGCCTAAVQGPTMLLLSPDGDVNPVMLAVVVVATPVAAWLGLSAVARFAARRRTAAA